jgi:hypothetical protein
MTNKVAKWKRWGEAICGDCANLLLSRDMFIDLHEMIAKNQKMQQSDYFHEYMKDTYVAHALMMVRKHLKVGADSISLTALASDICENTSCAPNPGFTENISHQLTRFLDAARKLESFADRVIAHRDKRAPTHTPTYNEVNDAIDAMDRLAIQCSCALGLNWTETCKPTVQYGWLTIFRDMGIET